MANKEDNVRSLSNLIGTELIKMGGLGIVQIRLKDYCRECRKIFHLASGQEFVSEVTLF